MTGLVVQIYRYLRHHRLWLVLSLLVVTAALSLLVFHQTYKEDISDFLPLNNKYNHALRVYQDISGANRILAIFQYKDTTQTDPDTICAAIDNFVSIVGDPESLELTSQIDLERVAEITSFVYDNIPYFLTAPDYARIDSILADDNYVERQIAADKQMLMFPVSGLLSENFQRDPLNLFTPVVAQLQQKQTDIRYENYDGYIFSADMQRAIVMMNSPYGASETEKNTALLERLEQCARETEHQVPAVSIHFIGGPVIAVGNSSQIKTDSLVAVLLAIVLIVALLFFVFRNVWNLLLIVLSTAWGWLFAMGALALIHDQVSVIVIGISSVILGIAVNYPLHLIAHLQHTPDIKSALKEIVMPLVVGNITTVGAFLALVPLKSVALRDLGLFSSLLLIGTILFVLIYLPHLIASGTTQKAHNIFSRISDFSLENKRWIVNTTILLTIVFGYFSFQTDFDANISHINYMTDAQKADMAYFSSSSNANQVYVVSSDTLMDGALDKSLQLQPFLSDLQQQGLVADIQSCSQFLCSKAEQAQRLALWHSFIERHGSVLESSVKDAARREGFAQGTFDDFFRLLHTPYEQQAANYFTPLTSTIFTSNLTADSIHRKYNVISVLKVAPDHINDVVSRIDNASLGSYAFDVTSMNSSIATRLSDDFNYIGWACGLIVFFFLWFSLGSLELALLSFLPMAISWIWILGMMALLDIQFNVVNIILATFIFGQGDDYTIFMTEGCQYEYAYRRKMLASYKNSIIISAIIMFIGIGTLIFAKHPALHSLAQVTIIGMFSVVLMAYLFPPLIFNWLVKDQHGYRLRPLTLKTLLGFKPDNDYISIVRDRYRYKGVEIFTAVKKNLAHVTEPLDIPELTERAQEETTIYLTDDSWGEISFLIALEHPDMTFIATMSDEDRLTVATHSASALAPNLSFRLG